MSGMGLLGSALAGGVKGLGQGMVEVDRRRAEEESYTNRLEAAESIRARYAEQAELRAEERAATKAGKVESRASEIANQGGKGLISQANSQYEKLKATDPEGARLGLEAVRQAEADGAYAQEVTSKHRLQAMRETGAIDPKTGLTLDIEGERHAENLVKSADDTAYSREQDKKSNARADADLDLRRQQVRQSAATNAIQHKVARLAYDQAVSASKIPPAVKLRYESLDESLKAVTKSIMDAKAKGEFDDKQGADLVARQTELVAAQERLLSPYLPDEVKEKPKAVDPLDPYGIGLKPKSAATTSNRIMSGGRPAADQIPY